MVRMTDLSAAEQEMLMNFDCPSFEIHPWVSGPPLSQRRVAMVTTAGLHGRNDHPFERNQSDFYRVIPGDAQANDLVMSHMAASFDRSGYQRDWNIIFPLDRLREMVDEKIIGSLADFHYSFGTPLSVEESEIAAKEITDLCKKDHVNAILLFPV